MVAFYDIFYIDIGEEPLQILTLFFFIWLQNGQRHTTIRQIFLQRIGFLQFDSRQIFSERQRIYFYF